MKYILSILLASFALVPLQAKAGDINSGVPNEAATMSGIYLRGDLGASWLNSGATSNALSYTGSAGVGYQIDSNLRTDLTYDWTGNFGVAPAGTLSTNVVLLNGYYDIANSTPFTPYVGVGIGYGWEWGTGGAVSDQGIAVGVNAGVAYNLNNNIALDVGYRFRDVFGGTQAAAEHEVAAGLRVKF